MTLTWLDAEGEEAPVGTGTDGIHWRQHIPLLADTAVRSFKT